jgi:hypothetical protein
MLWEGAVTKFRNWSIGTPGKCFLFPLLNIFLKTIKKINLLILITFIQISNRKE